MIDLREFKDCFERKIPLEESLLVEFFVDPETSINKYGINSENNWSNPNILPNRFDQNWQKYFERIGNWGIITINHVDPENKKREEITINKFINSMGNSDLQKLYGKFRTEIIKVNRCEFIREYIGIDGKMYKEIFQIKIDLKPELKKGLSFWQFIF
jgi:hypothetical protein